MSPLKVSEELDSKYKVRKCFVKLERIDVSKELHRLKLKLSEVQQQIDESEEDDELSDGSEMGDFFSTLPKKVITIKGIGRVTLPEKARLISKVNTPKGPMIVLDRKCLQINLKRLNVPQEDLDETLRFYKNYLENEKQQANLLPQPTLKSSVQQSHSHLKQQLPSKQQSPMIMKQYQPQDFSMIKPKEQPKNVILKLTPEEKSWADLANFLGGHWFSSSGPVSVHESVQRAFSIQQSLASKENQGLKLQKLLLEQRPVIPGVNLNGKAQARLQSNTSATSSFTGIKENPGFGLPEVMPKRRLMQNPAATGSVEVIDLTGLPDETPKDSVAMKNSLQSLKHTPDVKVVKIRTFFEKDGNVFIKKVSCPFCSESTRVELLKEHMDKQHRSIPTQIKDNKNLGQSANPPKELPNEKIPAGCVRCKHCRKIITMNEVLTHGCFYKRPTPTPTVTPRISSPSQGKISVKPMSSLMPNSTTPKSPLVMAQCSKCKETVPFVKIDVHECFSNRKDVGLSNLNKVTPQTDPKPSILNCRNCFELVPSDQRTTHVCRQQSESSKEDPNTLLKCSNCNNGKLYSVMALKEHNIMVHGAVL